jgi:hypothetical protein
MNLRRCVAAGTLGLGLTVIGQAGAAIAAAESGQPTLEAGLVNAEKNSARGWATVQVKVGGVELVDPASVGEVVKKGQGHLHYRLDDGPVVATTAPKLSFHDLKPGRHRIEVVLAANDHSSTGVERTVEVEIPPSAAHAHERK